MLLTWCGISFHVNIPGFHCMVEQYNHLILLMWWLVDCVADEHEMCLMWHSRFIGKYKKEILKLVGILATGSFDGLIKQSQQRTSEDNPLLLAVQTNSTPNHLQTQHPPRSSTAFRSLMQTRIRIPAGICLPLQGICGQKPFPPLQWWWNLQNLQELAFTTGSLALTGLVTSKPTLESILTVAWYART